MLDVARWLAEQVLGHHPEAFVEAAIDFGILPELTDGESAARRMWRFLIRLLAAVWLI
jgi:hypothetical protein